MNEVRPWELELMFAHTQLKCYIIVVTRAFVFFLICTPSSLGPAALGNRMYISGRTLAMLQLLNVPLLNNSVKIPMTQSIQNFENFEIHQNFMCYDALAL